MSQHDLIAVASVRHAYDEIAALLHRSAGLVRALAASKVLPIRPNVLNGITEEITNLARVVHAGRPAEACLSCKRIPEVQTECMHCWGVGWVQARVNDRLPDELKAVEPPMVRYRGSIITARRA
jgi:hypothetical protein